MLYKFKIMKNLIFILFICILPLLGACQQKKSTKMEQNPKYNKLNDYEKAIIIGKHTDRAYTGEYTDNKEKGTYICRQCNNALYKSDDKFESNCGWPSFDDEIEGSVKRIADADGFRTEIVCNNCNGHLGHVFLGEGFTKKDTRHCVNSTSMKFIKNSETLPEVIK
jgi:methionine-R-sulfoxide reductase